MLKQLVLETIKNKGLINYGEGVIVGISGGYDSVCLLHVLYSISKELGIKIYPVHINHMLRGEEALRDENFVRSFCSSLGLEVYVKHIDVAKKAKSEKTSLEEAGRNARYETFSIVAEEQGASKIAVAHSRNDQAETILMRICRGTGLEGLRGMEYKRDNIIRPLLDVDRYQIEEYVKGMGIEAVTDSSNLHTDYFRNRIRLNVIPAINEASGADVTENLLRLSKIVVAEDDYLRYNSELYYQKSVLSEKRMYTELDLKILMEVHQAVRLRMLRIAVGKTCGTLNGFEYIHMDKLNNLIENGRTGAQIDLPHSMTAVRTYNSLILKEQGKVIRKQFEEILQIPGETEIQNEGIVVKTEIIKIESIKNFGEFINCNEKVHTKFIDLDKLISSGKSILLRNRRDGDIFKPLKSNGTKKLKEYFIDNKVPREIRDIIPLIALGKEIVWIVGNKISDNYKVTDNTKNVLKISCILEKK
ncbi:tRNA lysidine(34) synthetase TilS [Ruminiclostridium josui]|uniref:tRNA lysidine(34) synthetase TilS n=1 Tax=Ruminiclostridium josui TaxID=1499 RepID=UPI000466D32B|nr:tRNA lysidine(34) synthetase TilS [Ruminiclostridium josui]